MVPSFPVPRFQSPLTVMFRFKPRPAGQLTALPRLSRWIKWERVERRREEREDGEGKERKGRAEEGRGQGGLPLSP